MPDQRLIGFFRKNLLEWSALNLRPMPWKAERDPYKVWLSEIILQQTRVQQGLPYYQKFVLQYPTVRHLANAPEDEVMKLWEGLGYYTRARNLHAAAKHISDELDGNFPTTYEQILALKGIGTYTAAAISSFAFGLPNAVLDGNVYRVLARFFGIESLIDTPAAKKQFSALAQCLLDPANPAAHNQAIMDFGATCCTPQQPRCPDCPLRTECLAYQAGIVDELPLKSKGLVKKKRNFYYLIFNYRGGVFVRKRTGKDIWRGLWEFPQVLHPIETSPVGAGSVQISRPFRQLLTHQEVTVIFYEISLPDDVSDAIFQNPIFDNCEIKPRKELKKNIAFPKVIDCYLQNYVLTLNDSSQSNHV